MEFILEDNVAKPKPVRARSGRESAYPFAAMKVNQSFKVVYESEDKAERQKVDRKVRTAILSFKAKSAENKSLVFSTRTVSATDEKDGKAGIRVFRDAAKATSATA